MYRAHDAANGGATVAVKVLELGAADSDDVARIEREIAFMAECDHPNIVKYLGSHRCVELLLCCCIFGGVCSACVRFGEWRAEGARHMHSTTTHTKQTKRPHPHTTAWATRCGS